MNILSIRAENFKRLRAVQINPDRSLIRITGANGSGKSSVLDAVWVTLAGMKVAPSQPIREGADDALVELILGDAAGPKFKVRRTFANTPAGKMTSQLIVETAAGARYPSPQALLDGFLGALTFDPEAFTRMSPKDRLDVLKGMVKLEMDVDTLEAQNRADFENRTLINREIKSFAERVGLYTAGVHSDMDVTPIDVSAIATKIAEATEANKKVLDHRARVLEADNTIGRMKREIDDLNEQIAKLEARQSVAVNVLREWEDTRDALHAVGEPPVVDVEDLTRQIKDAEKENAARNLERQQREKLKTAVDQYDAAMKEAEAATSRIDSRKAMIAQALRNAVYPVRGLTLGDTDVLLNGFPYSQAATGEQLVASFEMAMAVNPDLKIVRIKDGSLMDSKSLAIVGELATAKGYQVLVEEVDESGAIGFYLEDGALVAIDGVAQ